MNIIAVGRNERIQYRNVDQFTEDEDYFIMHSLDDQLVEVIVNCHMVACSDEIIIEKCCFICDEVYIENNFGYSDTDSVFKAKAALNKKYGKEVMRSDKNDSTD